MKGGQRPLPELLPPGVLPPEDSRMWYFSPKSLIAGRAWVQPDTWEWLDANWPVEVGRFYPTHPRWLLQNRPTMRGSVANHNIIAEIHLAIRLRHDLPEFPPFVHGRIALKQQQASLAYRITKAVHKAVSDHHIDEVITTFRDKAPGQFVKWMTQTFIPKKVEIEKVPNADEALTREDAKKIGDAILEELTRRKLEASIAEKTPHDQPDPALLPDPAKTLDATAIELHEAAADAPFKIGSSKSASPTTVTRRLLSVKDKISLEPTSDIDWDN